MGYHPRSPERDDARTLTALPARVPLPRTAEPDRHEVLASALNLGLLDSLRVRSTVTTAGKGREATGPVHVVGLVEVVHERFRKEAIEKRVAPQFALEDAPEAALRIPETGRADETWILAGTITPKTVRGRLESPVADRIDLVLTSSWMSAVRRPEPRPDVGLHGATFYAFPLLERFGLVSIALDSDVRGRVVDGACWGIRLGSSVERDPDVERLLAELAREEAGDPSSWSATPLARFPEEHHRLSDFAGGAACAECHAEQAADWPRADIRARSPRWLRGAASTTPRA